MTLSPTQPFAGRDTEILDFAGSGLFARTFAEGMTLVEEAAAYLDGEGRRDSRLLSRPVALAYAAESMRLTTRLMQVASWLLVQRAVGQGDMNPAQACDPRYRLPEGPGRTQAAPADLPIALVEFAVQADRLHDRILHLDRKLYVEDAPVERPNGVMDQMGRLREAFGS